MRSSLVLFCLLLIYSTQTTQAQAPTQAMVAGWISDDKDVAIPFAAVELYASADSSVVTGAATDEGGKFSLAAPAGNYFLKVSFLAYAPKTITDIQLTENTMKSLGQISMEAEGILLDDLEIVEERSQMELHVDKRVFNVGKDLANVGSNASELLDNIPSVNVDIEGNVSLRGSENVRILVDGKPSGLVGLSNTDALRNLQSSLIEKVEVITNPSSKYDAEGEVGIINLVLKKEKGKGVNGSFTATTGYPHNHGLTYNINYRRKKVNLFSNFGFNYREGPGGGSTYLEYLFNDELVKYRSEREHVRGGLSNSIQFGADYFLNDKNTITISGLYKYSNGNNNASVTYRDFDANDVLLNTTVRTDEEAEPSHNAEGALNYTKTFAQKGRKWSFDAKYNLRDDTETTEYLEQSTDPTIADVIQKSDNTEDEQNWLFQTDYIHPFSKDSKMEMGLKATFRAIQNDFTVEQIFDDQFEILPEFDDKLLYNENIYAAYFMAANKTGRFSYQGGLRAEYSDIRTELIESGESNPREYLNFFPSVHLAYEFANQNTFQVSYSRRISRPRFWYLLPFITFSDRRNRFGGNPNLNPEYTDSYEAGYLRNFEKGTFLASAYYRHSTGVIARVTVVNDEGNTDLKPINLATKDAYGAESNITVNLSDWWRLTTSFNFYYFETAGIFEGTDYGTSGTTWNANMNHKFKLPGKVDLQTSFDYRAPENTIQGKVLSMFTWNAGISKELLKDKATLTFSAKDILNTRKRRMLTDTPDLYSELEFQWRSRQFLLSFNYRLNQKKKMGGRGGY